ncbi:hypothetical protein HUW51_16920 [Adhaeribacter swui]|uniref:Auto-transporter adhesin head GIN domain-containing protein n=1 Tax=Adhaeribacter swui TaxID=2086471 RepID=A0A7G7GAY7_9BACT|nr:hypothetical protein [Adhaeribacter swui]QNF34321.1 hypothetical protein HUW51_16920 [Adhaeribacter swui]
MKQNLLYALLLCALSFSALSAQTYFELQNDSFAKAVKLVKSYISLDNKRISINLTNSHNGRYIITSSLLAENDSLELRSHIKNMLGGAKDTILRFQTQEFIQKLDNLLVKKNTLKIAGHYQAIKISNGKEESEFATTDGQGLMTLLEYGE